MRAQSSVGFDEKYLQAQECGQRTTFHTLFEAKAMPASTSTRRGERIRGRFISIHAHDEQKRIKRRRDGHSKKVEKSYSSVDCKRRSANPRGSTSVRSRSKSVRNRAISRRNACSPIARQVLQRQRILHKWVSSQKSRLIKDGKIVICSFYFCVFCRSRVNHQSWKQFVFSIATQDTSRKEAERATRQQNKKPGHWCQSQKFKTKIKRGVTGKIWKIGWSYWLVEDLQRKMKETDLHVSVYSSPEFDFQRHQQRSRGSKVSLPTSPKTKITMSAWKPECALAKL